MGTVNLSFIYLYAGLVTSFGMTITMWGLLPGAGAVIDRKRAFFVAIGRPHALILMASFSGLDIGKGEREKGSDGGMDPAA